MANAQGWAWNAPSALTPNLDASLTVFDATGAVVAFVDPISVYVSERFAGGLSASISGLALGKGLYTVVVDGVGRAGIDGYSDYASLGPFTLTGGIS